MQRLTLTTVVTLALAAGLLGAGRVETANAATAQSGRVVNLAPSRVLGFTWVRGQQAWRPGSLSRIGRSVFSLDGAGRFAVFQPDGYPTLRGSWRGGGGTIRFTARHVYSTGFTGSNGTEVQGTLDTRTGTVRLLYVAGTTLAAVVGGQKFGLSNVKVFQARLQLRSI